MTLNSVGFVGTGNIGEPMVEQLLTNDWSVAVYARRDDVRSRLSRAGARIVDTAVDLARCDIVVCCLFTDEQVIEVCTPIIERMRRGSVFVSHTTGSPDTLRTLAPTAKDGGVLIVEAPFSGRPEAVREGRLTVMLAGDDVAVAIAASVVGAYASAVVRTGSSGTALSTKLLNNALFAAFTQLTLSAIDAAESLGIEQDSLLDVLDVSSGGSAAARHLAASGLSAADYSATLPRYLVKDLESVRSVASELGADVSDLLAAARLGPMNLDQVPVP